jgi:tetratricopeptide (TPR) repeat protein
MDGRKMDRILNLIGILEGTNKAGLYGGGYLEPYENFLQPFRDREFCLLELGVYQGASLRTWRAYFPKANIVGIDINPACRQHAGDRTAVFIGSQDDPELLDRVMNEHRPSIVVDDGSHMAHHVLASFERIFPGLQAGGYYIVEDAYMHFGEQARHNLGYAKTPVKDYFFKLIEDIAGNAVAPEDNHGIGAYLHKHVEFVGVVAGAIVIRKKPVPLALTEVMSKAEALAKETGSDQYRIGVARLMLRAGDMLDRAEEILRDVIANDGPRPELVLNLAEALERQHRLDDAIAVLQESLERDTGWSLLGSRSHFLGRMAHYHSLKGDHKAALASLREDAELRPAVPDTHYLLSVVMERAGDMNGAIEEGRHAVGLNAEGKNLSEYQAHLERLIAKQKASAGP